MKSNPNHPDHPDRGLRASIACPHCGAATRVRSSREVTPLVRQLNLICFNTECGATYRADITITHAISPSSHPNPAVQLRQSPPRKRADNDNACRPEVRPAANDDDRLGEAVLG